MTRPDVASVLGRLDSLGAPGVEELSPAQARAQLEESVLSADLPVSDIAVERPLTIPTRAGNIAGLLLDARLTRGPGPVLLWYHGGGFVTGGLDTHRSFAAHVARHTDLPVVLVDYRLAPEAPFPAAVEDAEDAARWVADSPADLGREADAVVVGGDSAGGTLAITTAMALRDAPAARNVLAQLVVYPGTDLSRRYDSRAEYGTGRILTSEALEWYHGHYQADPSDWRGSPLLGSLAGLPPAVVLTAGEDPVRDEGRAYAAGLVTAGVETTFHEATGNVHGFVLMRRAVPSAQDDTVRALDALTAVLRSHGGGGRG
ncbi:MULTISPECIES: alpha/beta hydrolase [Streptomyces]|uniref:alpha/beta hydrolase n=1 Tax=Streptomyces TaxID=1883 RepID=UPI0036C2A2CA